MRVHIVLSHEGKTFEGEVLLVPSEPAKRSGPKIKARVDSVAATPKRAIMNLYLKGFFKEARTLGDVVRELAKNEYNFGSSSIVMALQRSNFIRQRGAKGSYTFVQKIPPSAFVE